MYKLQAKTSKEEPKNTTRKRFRGGADEPAQMKIENSSAPTEEDQSIAPLPDIETPSQLNEYEASPAPVSELESPPADETPADATPADATQADAAQGEVVTADAPQSEVVQNETVPAEGFGEQPVDMFGPPSEPESAITGEGESAEIEAFRNMMGNPEAQQVYFYMNTNISTEENRDKSYKREGVLHFTDSVSVGASQNTIMSLGSVIGNRGIETTTYDKLRNIALQKVGILLGETRRCYNTKIGFERNGETILVHIYGTVYSKKSEQPTI